MFMRANSFFTSPQTKLKWWEVVFLIAIAAAVLWLGLMTAQQRRLAESMLRLHVVANSDEAEDQALKLKVRDAVLSCAEDWLEGVEDPKEAEAVLSCHLTELEQAGEQVTRENGYSYPVKASLEQVHFPTKYYDGFALPAGEYRALRVVLGEGAGQNWWCVVFPGLCVAPAAEWQEVAVSGGISPSDVELMEENESGYILRFRCLEWLDALQQRWAD